MKFTSTFSALLVVLPMIASVSGLAVPEAALVNRQRGGFGGQQQGRGGAAANSAAAKAAAAKAAAASAAAAKAAAAKGAAGKGAAATTAAAAATTAAAATATTAAAASGNNAAAGAAAAGSGAAAAGGDLQSSTTIDPSVIQNTGTGQDPPVAGQANAATSPNNFANFCALTLPQVPITNGLQTTTGSCNPIPIGLIPSTSNIPSAKFQSPTNGDTIAANTAFNVTLGAKNIQLGTFTNAQQTYFGNPQTLNAQGQIIGHTHIVVCAMMSSTSPSVLEVPPPPDLLLPLEPLPLLEPLLPPVTLPPPEPLLLQALLPLPDLLLLRALPPPLDLLLLPELLPPPVRVLPLLEPLPPRVRAQLLLPRPPLPPPRVLPPRPPLLPRVLLPLRVPPPQLLPPQRLPPQLLPPQRQPPQKQPPQRQPLPRAKPDDRVYEQPLDD